MPLQTYDGSLDAPTMNIDFDFANHPITGAKTAPETSLSNATITQYLPMPGLSRFNPRSWAAGQKRIIYQNQNYTTPSTPLLYSMICPNSRLRASQQSFFSDSGVQGANAVNIPLGSIVQIRLFSSDGGQHPIHIHGKSFVICDYSSVNSNGTVKSRTRAELDANMFAPCGSMANARQPIRRDIVTLSPATDPDKQGNVKQGYAIIRFKATVPGVWLLHCHIDWHFEIGLAMALVVGYDQLTSNAFQQSVPQHIQQECSNLKF